MTKLWKTSHQTLTSSDVVMVTIWLAIVWIWGRAANSSTVSCRKKTTSLRKLHFSNIILHGVKWVLPLHGRKHGVSEVPEVYVWPWKNSKKVGSKATVCWRKTSKHLKYMFKNCSVSYLIRITPSSRLCVLTSFSMYRMLPSLARSTASFVGTKTVRGPGPRRGGGDPQF